MAQVATRPPPTPATQRSEIFISYSRRNAEFVHRLHDALEGRGVKPWVDWQDIPPTFDWMQEIHAAIEGADIFIFVMSPDSLASTVCGRELQHALTYHKRVVPIVYRDAPVEDVPPDLARLNWIFMRDGDDFAAGVEKVVEALHTDPDWLHLHTYLLQRAIQWEQRDHDVSLLLRGNDLRQAETWLAGAAGKSPEPTSVHTQYIIESRRRETRQHRRVIALTTLGMIAMLVVAVLAWIQRNDAIAAANLVRSRSLIDESAAQLKRDPELGILLAVQAVHDDDTPQAEDALRQAISASHIRARLVDPNRDSIYSVAMSPSDRYIATGGLSVGRLRVWNRRTGKLLWVSPQLEVGLTVDHLQFIKRHEKLILATAGGHVQLWNWQTRRRLLDLHLPSDELTDGVADASGRYIAISADSAGGVWIWDVARGKISRQLSLAPDPHTYFHLALDPSGTYLAVTEKTGLDVFDWRKQVRIARLPIHSATDVQFSPDGTRLVVQVNAGAEVWDWRSGRRESHFGPLAHDAQFAPDGNHVVTSDVLSGTEVWDWRTQTLLLSLTGSTAGVGNHGGDLATADVSGTVYLWDWHIGDEISALPAGSDEVQAVAFDPAGRNLATASWDGTARVWDWRSGRQEASVKPARAIAARFVDGVAFSSNGRYLLTGNGALTTWDWRRARPVHRLTAPENSLDRLTMSAGGQWLVAGGDPAYIANWRTAHGGKLEPCSGSQTSQIQDAAISSDGQYVAVSTGDVDVWSARQSESCAAAHDHVTLSNGKTAEAVSFSPDGRYLVASDGDSAVVWDWRARKQLFSLPDGNGVDTAAFSPDGTYLVTGSDTGSATIWNWRTGAAVETLESNGTFHAYFVNGAIWSPNGRYVALATGYRAVPGSNLGLSAAQATRLGYNQAFVYACDVCVSGQQLLDLAASRVTRSLTDQERNQYIP